jgi:hypothetical protein
MMLLDRTCRSVMVPFRERKMPTWLYPSCLFLGAGVSAFGLFMSYKHRAELQLAKHWMGLCAVGLASALLAILWHINPR